MIASFRRSVRSWAAALILFLALVALVITGFGTDGFGGLGSLSGAGREAELAEVDGKRLTEGDASDLITRQYNIARQQEPTLDMASFVAGGYDQMINQLILTLALQAFGEEQGLVVSQRMVDREIVRIPAFRDFTGQFDQAAFQRALAQQRITEAQLREDIARSLMQRQLLGPLARGVSVPDGIAREYANLLLERRRGAIGIVPADLMREGINPTDQEVAAFYNGNRGRFTIPERRVVRYAMFGPQQVAEAARATDEEIAAFYRQNSDRYGGTETRTLQHLPVQDARQAQAAVQQLRGGRSFAEVASSLGFSAADLTYADQTQAAFAGETAPAVAQAAFAAAQGEVVGPVSAAGTFHVVRVERVSRSAERPLETVRGEIAETIEQRKLADALGALVNRIEDRLAEGASLEEVARTERLNVVTTPPITESGQVPGQLWVVPPEMQPLLRAAFEIDPEDPEPVVEEIESNRRFAMVGIERVIPAAPPPLAQIRDQVRAALIGQRALERARTLADAIAARINAGTPATQAFAQAQPRLPAPQSINMQRLEISRAGAQAPPPLITLFSLPQGRAHVIPAPERGGWFVVHHQERTPGNAADRPELITATRTGFAASAAEELAQQFARAVELGSGVERNEEAIRRLRQRLLGSLAE